MTWPQWKQLASSLSLNLCKPVQNTGNSYSFGHSDSYGHLGFASQKGKKLAHAKKWRSYFRINSVCPKWYTPKNCHSDGKTWKMISSPDFGDPLFSFKLWIQLSCFRTAGWTFLPSFFCRLFPCWSTQPRCKCRASPKANFAAMLQEGWCLGRKIWSMETFLRTIIMSIGIWCSSFISLPNSG